MEYNIQSVDRKHLLYGTKLCDSQGKKEKNPLFNAWVFSLLLLFLPLGRDGSDELV